MTPVKLNALFFGTHPDDVELTCSGTLAKLKMEGMSVGIADLTRGELSTRGNLTVRKMETDKATKILNLDFRTNLQLEDGNIVNNVTNRRRVIKLLRLTKPELVFAPYPLDRHPDHINASNLIRESVFYSGLRKIVTAKLGVFRPRKVIYYSHAYDIPVTFIFDISDTFDIKMKSVEAFESQFFNLKKSNGPETFISRKDFREYVLSKAKYYGFKIGVEYGEPFFTYEPVKVEAGYISLI
ncbi:MAG: bacillithiol biosynthesis deacetylase BshB1 [Ignavibacteriaceae bacterium]|nr:bacillithiol biosynthesis deacetylase BshB1 [Ignavibacteriaceae bacterium]